MSRFLIIKDMESLSRSWSDLNELLNFERGSVGDSRALKQETLLGIWIEHSLLPPDSLRMGDTFSLSGVWSLCDLRLNENPNDKEFTLRQLLVRALLTDPSSRGKFVPVFEITDSQQSIQSEIFKILSEYPRSISKYVISDLSKGEYRIEEISL